MTIPLFKVYMAPEAADRVASTLASGYVGEGPRVAEFEQALGELIGSPVPPLATNSCTSAIDLALHLCGVGPVGKHEDDYPDVVITTPMTCTATNTMVVNRGAYVAWADVDPVTGLIDPKSVKRLLDRYELVGVNIRAIMAVDWGGRLCDYDALNDALHGKGLTWIIQDAAHSLLATDTHGDPGHYGADFTCYSFQAIKHLTTGDGGALIVPDTATTGVTYDRARLLRWYGLDRLSSASFRCDQRIEEAGFKYNMTDIDASIGLANLPHVEWVVERHRENARFYHEMLRGTSADAMLPPSDEGSAWWLYTILVDDRDAFIAFAAEKGVECSPVHSRNDLHPAFQRACLNPNDPLPGVDAFASREVAIPVHWALTGAERIRVANVVREWGYLKRRPKVTQAEIDIVIEARNRAQEEIERLRRAGRDVKAEAMEQFA